MLVSIILSLNLPLSRSQARPGPDHQPCRWPARPRLGTNTQGLSGYLEEQPATMGRCPADLALVAIRAYGQRDRPTNQSHRKDSSELSDNSAKNLG